MGPRARILIADDHALVADGIAKVLSTEFDVVGIASNGQELVKLASDLKPNLVCLDISMPLTNGLQAAVRLSQDHPRLKLVFVTQQLSLPYVRAAFRAGAQGYVCKQSASSEVLTAVREVLAGNRFVTPLIREDDLEPEMFVKDAAGVFTDTLTERQRQVLKLIAEGKTNKETAQILCVSPKTVEFHRLGLMNGLGIRTTAELTRYAVSHGLVD